MGKLYDGWGRKYDGWAGFEEGTWVNEINLRSFI